MEQIAPFSIGIPQEPDAGKYQILHLDKPFITISGDGIDVLVAVRVCTALNLLVKYEEHQKMKEELWAVQERLDRVCTEPVEV